MTFALGSSAYEVEAWSDEQVWELVQKNLVGFFGDAAAKAVKKSMWRSNWASNPNFGGTYSFAKLGSVPTDWDALADDHMNGQLHFAGEHTDRRFRGTVHGAFYSGTRVASEILSKLGCKPQDDFDEDLGELKVQTAVRPVPKSPGGFDSTLRERCAWCKPEVPTSFLSKPQAKVPTSFLSKRRAL
jgi:hypothetical protein